MSPSFLDWLTGDQQRALPSLGDLLGANTPTGTPPSLGDLLGGSGAGPAPLTIGQAFGTSGPQATQGQLGLGTLLPDPAPLAQPSLALGMAQIKAARAESEAAAKPKAPATTTPAGGVTGGLPANAVAPPADPQAAQYYGFANAHMPYAMQAVRDLGVDIDPAIAVAVAANETGWGQAPGSGAPWNSFHGIRGTGTAGQTPGGFRANTTPQESYQDFIRLVTQDPTYADAYQRYQQTRDPNQFIADIANAGYASSQIVERNGQTEAQNWIRQVQGLMPQVRQWWQADVPAGSTQPVGGRLQGVSQNDLGLPPDVAAAFCGPSAAIAFARANGRNPTTIEAMNLARARGWNPTTGMAGPQSEVQLLNDVGVPAYLEPVNWQKVASEALAGRGAILSSPGATGHYFQVLSANPQTGDLLLGDAVGANRWVQPQAIGALGYGTPDYAIYRR